MQSIFVKKLLEWYKDNNRNYLPWRQTKEAYNILVAEMMLQKTTAQQVERTFGEFVKKFSCPESLAEASIEEIRRVITPLGMQHRRALRFKEQSFILPSLC